ncbi:MAG: Gfo/Idh/MocA family oxidoreductase [Lentisphaeria bacterium]|nr:Gfo/Idh/MocA family oxidoreductase [Lentisphaeria bacterium]
MVCRIAVIGGSGHIGYVAEGMRQCPEAVLCAVAPGSETEDGTGLCRRLGAVGTARVYEDYRDLLAREEIDIAVVAPEFHRHATITCAALEAGAAVYCEKPLALTAAGLDDVRQSLARTRRPLGMMLAFRYEPAFREARDIVRSGRIGTPTVGYAQKSYKRGRRPDSYRRRETFGGIIPWVGIHAVDWFRWVSGCEYRAVRALHVKLHCPDYPGMEDAATCLYELDNGGSAVMSFDFLRPPGAPSHGDDRLRLVGDKGALEIRTDGTLEVIDARGPERIVTPAPPLGCFADFVRSVVDPGHPCALTAEEALRITEIVLRTRDAADTGERIVL